MKNTVEWIEPSYRMPQDDTPVLVIAGHKGNQKKAIVYVGWWDSGSKCWACAFDQAIENPFDQNKVIYWASLPELPWCVNLSEL